jgi:hypothetical protein
MVVVLVVDSQHLDRGQIKFPGAAATNPWEHFQSLAPVALFAFIPRAPCLRDDSLKSV